MTWRWFPWQAAALALLATVSALAATGTPRLDRLEHLTSSDGLSNRWVLSLAQDRQGFLWVGTDDGLNRYDGYHFKIYRNVPGRPDSLSDNFIYAIAEDHQENLWVGTEQGLNRLDRLTDTFTRFSASSRAADAQTGPCHDQIFALLPDRHSQLWMIGDDCLSRFDPVTQNFTHFRHDPEDQHSLGTPLPAALVETRGGDLWVAGQGGLLDRFDSETQRFKHHPLLIDAASESPAYISALIEDREGDLWTGTESHGLFRFDPATGAAEHISLGLDAGAYPNANAIFSLLFDDDGLLWIATEAQGMYLYDPDSGAWSNHRHDPDEPGSLSNDRIMQLFADRTGVIWIGTDTGLNKFVSSREAFRILRHKSNDATSPSADSVWPIHEDATGHLWLGTIDKGLDKLDRQRRVIARYRHDPEDPTSLASDVLTALHEDSDGDLWVASDRGLDRLDKQTGSFLHLSPDADDADSLIEGWIYALLEDREGQLWIGGIGGLNRLDRHTLALERWRPAAQPHSLAGDTIYAMAQDREGHLWLGTSDSGLSRFDHRRQTFHTYRHLPDDPASLADDSIASLYFQTSTGILWVGTSGAGLARFDTDSETFRHYRQADGLPNEHILAIREDREGRLWMSTNLGLASFDLELETFTAYDTADGLADNSFFQSSSWRSTSGELFFGSPAGVVILDPDDLASDPYPPPVAISELLLLNTPRPFASRASNEVGEPLHLTLSHRDYVLGFEFTALNLARPSKNRYAYQLVGLDRDWVEVDARKRFAHYSNLAPGDYVFRVKASNADGLWSSERASLELTVLPSPWQTWWAFSFYSVGLVALVGGYVWSQKRKIARERAINSRLRQVDRMKDEFLANTSHELRTPLYGIIGLTESLIDGAGGQLPENARSNLAMVAASGRRLSKLVEDVLDFSKLSRKSLELRKKPVDLAALTEVVLQLSRPLIGDKRLRLVNAVARDLPAVAADEDRLQQILYNLIGNAVKFTSEGKVEVTAVCEEEWVEVRVADTGIGIPPEKHAAIFEAFKQADASTERHFGGTGLGLAVTRQLIKLHGGSIRVESRPLVGATFIFTLPLADDADDTADPSMSWSRRAKVFETIEESVAPRPLSIERQAADTDYRLLVVDDEPVNRQVLINHLGAAGYRIEQAASGAEALAALDGKDDFDLVLLDIMMPAMSGFEVCERIRRRSSPHELPVIFLTAKNQVQDRVTGLSSGANDYLIKPVAKDELLARVKTHLEIRDIARHLEELVAERTARLKILSGLLPICSVCRRIRDDSGSWNQLEDYLQKHSEATLTHGICPTCTEKHYPQALHLGAASAAAKPPAED